MEFRNQRKKVINQTKPRHGKPPNHVRRSTTFDNYSRLLPLGLITLEDIPAGVEELRRIAKKGMRGAMIWAEPPEDRPYSLPDYDAFWAAAQELNLPLSLHILTSRRGMGSDFFKGNLARQVAILHHEIERSLAVFVLDGVLERFPQLKIVSAENDVAWVPYFMWRMDFAQDRFGRSGATPVKLSQKPSEYVKRQVYATFINEPIFIHTVSLYGADNGMWSSDYPHTAAVWPRSSSSLKRLSVGFRRITGAR
jgi:predicted TIM-barrel fold metal-dependent hydrolase